MADRREPPFFNDDPVGAFHHKLPFYETMDLFIETLTGTCFELRVSPFETVISVKAKIQRLEGIPVAQQHLIWNSLELEDGYCLHDYNIAEGSTLKLVLAMRGGPINTRRVTVDDSVKEITDFVDSAREEVSEKPPSNKQVTFLVYREGDQLNFFRVVDRGDGTLTPVSELISGDPVHNIYAEDEEQVDGSVPGQLTVENSITMSKMKLLKSKMEGMNLNKKPKKSAKVRVRPPVTPRPCNPSRHQRFLRVPPQIGHASSTHLPPIRDQQQPAATPTAASPAHLTVSSIPGHASSNRKAPSFAPSVRYPLQGERLWDRHILAKGGVDLLTEGSCSPLPAISGRGVLDVAVEEVERLQSDAVAIAENSVLDTASDLLDPAEAMPFRDVLPEPLSLDLASQQGDALDCEEAGSEHVASANLLSQTLGPNPVSTGSDWFPSQLYRAPLISIPLPSDPSAPSLIPQPVEFTAVSTLHPRPPYPPLPRSEHVPPRAVHPASLRAVRADSPTKRPDLAWKSEVRNITRLANQGVREPLGAISSATLFASLGREGLGARQGVPAPPAASLPASLSQLREDVLKRLSPPHKAPPTATTYMSSSCLGLAGGTASSARRLGTPSYALPPVKGPMGSKKKSSKHCFLCGKKTGLATSYECRCGHNFCATHRYAETHDCTFDYKSSGRLLLQDANPLISAPKLPKI